MSYDIPQRRVPIIAALYNEGSSETLRESPVCERLFTMQAQVVSVTKSKTPPLHYCFVITTDLIVIVHTGQIPPALVSSDLNQALARR